MAKNNRNFCDNFNNSIISFHIGDDGVWEELPFQGTGADILRHFQASGL